MRPRSMHSGRQYDPHEQSELREEEQAAAQSAQTGHQKAIEDDPLADMAPEDFLARLQDADISSPEYQAIEDLLQPHLSGTNVTSNYEHDDRLRIELRNLALADRIVLERNHGRLCTGPFLEVAQRVSGRTDKSVKERFTADEERAIYASFEEVKTAMQFLGIGGFATTKVADTTVNTRVERMEPQKRSKLASGLNKVFG